MGKVILITGASSGIGKESAQTLARAGHKVYAAARRLERMEELKDIGVIPLRFDITQPDQIESLATEVLNREEQFDVLINNAGCGVYGAVEDISMEEARRQFEVNFFGHAQLTQFFLPRMREAKRGTIINVSSVGGKIYTPMGAWYHASKHALEGWTDCLRLELQSFGIDVILVQPGAVDTEFGYSMVEPMLERSGSGHYSGLATAMANNVRKHYAPEKISPASLVAKTISSAVHARRPKTRYATGKFARPLIFARRILHDRLFDRLMKTN